MNPHPDDPLLIGVDGGATEVKAHVVRVLARPAGSLASDDDRPLLALGATRAAERYDALAGFGPVALERQRAEAAGGAIRPSPDEERAGERWLAAFERTLRALGAEARSRRVLVGIALPGAKTADGRGTAVVRNGPRIPEFLDRLELRLARAGIELVAPIAPLVSDGLAAGLGEDAREHGLFRDVDDAYLIGGGTGVAECFKLGRRVVGLDELAGSVAKAWELRARSGCSFDDALSARGINRAYAERAGAPLPLAEACFPERRALHGDALAVEILAEAASALAELIALRLDALRRLPPRAERAPRAGAPSAPGVRTFLARVVVGQQLGRLLGEPALADLFRRPVEAELVRRIEAARDPRLSERCLAGGGLRAGWLQASSARAAPALGAAAHALSWCAATRAGAAPHDATRAGAARVPESVRGGVPGNERTRAAGG